MSLSTSCPGASRWGRCDERPDAAGGCAVGGPRARRRVPAPPARPVRRRRVLQRPGRPRRHGRPRAGARRRHGRPLGRGPRQPAAQRGRRRRLLGEHASPRRRDGGPRAGLPRARREAHGHDRGPRRADAASRRRRRGWSWGWRTRSASRPPTGTCAHGSSPARSGAVLSVLGTNNGMLPRDRPWFVQAEWSGGGALADHLVHCTDLIDGLLDRPPRRVRAATNRVLEQTPPTDGGDRWHRHGRVRRRRHRHDRLLVEPAAVGADLGRADAGCHRDRGTRADRRVQPPRGGPRRRRVRSGGPSGRTWTPR